jgi:ketosteroid isomerase-like protein
MQEVDSFLTGWAAAEQAGDTATLDTLLAEDFTAVGPLGFILPKQAWQARHRSRDLTYDSFNLDDTHTRMFGDTAMVTARNDTTRGSYQGHPIPEAVRATLVLVTAAGGWKVAAPHTSFIAGTHGATPIPGGGNRPGPDGAER